MKQSTIIITTFLLLFLFLGLIGIASAQKSQRGSKKFAQSNPEAQNIDVIQNSFSPSVSSLRRRSENRDVPTTTLAPTLATEQTTFRNSRTRVPTFRRRVINPTEIPIIVSSTTNQVVAVAVNEIPIENEKPVTSYRNRDAQRNSARPSIASSTEAGRVNNIRTRTRLRSNLVKPNEITTKSARKYSSRFQGSPITTPNSITNVVTTIKTPEVVTSKIRGTYKAKIGALKQKEPDSSEENYPEEFKQIIKAKKLEHNPNKSDNSLPTIKQFIPKARDKSYRTYKPPTTTPESTTISKIPVIRTTKSKRPYHTNRNIPIRRGSSTTPGTSTEPVTVANDLENNVESFSRSVVPQMRTTESLINEKLVVNPTKSNRPSTNSLKPIRPNVRIRNEPKNGVPGQNRFKYTPTVPTLSTTANWEWAVMQSSKVERTTATPSYFWPTSSKSIGIQPNWTYFGGYRDRIFSFF